MSELNSMNKITGIFRIPVRSRIVTIDVLVTTNRYDFLVTRQFIYLLDISIATLDLAYILEGSGPII